MFVSPWKVFHFKAAMNIHQIAPQNLAGFLHDRPNTVLLDVREPWEHDLASLKSSILIPLATLTASVEEEIPEKSTPIVVYCHHGIRSLQACAQLAALGYTEVINLAGGIDRYSNEVDPTIPVY